MLRRRGSMSPTCVALISWVYTWLREIFALKKRAFNTRPNSFAGSRELRNQSSEYFVGPHQNSRIPLNKPRSAAAAQHQGQIEDCSKFAFFHLLGALFTVNNVRLFLSCALPKAVDKFFNPLRQSSRMGFDRLRFRQINHSRGRVKLIIHDIFGCSARDKGDSINRQNATRVETGGGAAWKNV